MRNIAVLATVLVTFASSAFAQVTGTWKTAEGNSGGYAVVAIALCSDGSGNYCGTITNIVGNDNTSAVGKTIIKDMQDKGNGKFSGGQIWAPDEDKWYKAKMQLNGNTLRVSGCVAGGLICRGQDWTRM